MNTENQNYPIDITAIIPVRLGSTRCKNKNIRPFFDTNLLLKKINVLKNVPEIKFIIVSSSDLEILDFCKKENVIFHHRDPSFSQNNTPGSQLFKCLADTINTTYMMYVTCVTPFINNSIYSDAIQLFQKYIVSNEYDSIISCESIKKFLWKDNKPLNYSTDNAPPSQFLPDIFTPTFAFNIITTKYVQETSSIISSKPFFYQLDQLSSIDIDTEYDFLISELLYKNGFESISHISEYLSIEQNKEIFLLDCTIRDGGFLNNWHFSLQEVINYYQLVSDIGIHYFECGFMFSENNNENGIWWNVTPQLIHTLKDNVNNSTKISVMILIENIHKLDYKIDGLDMIRILVNIKKSHISSNYIQDFKKLYKLGYTLTLNIAYVDILSDKELDSIFSLSCDYISCIYLADTFGSLNEQSLLKLIRKFVGKFKNIGFHGHNNLNFSVSNSLSAINAGVKFIDSTILGLGRGGGNTPTESLLLHLLDQNFNQFNIEPLFLYLDKQLNKDEKSKIIYQISGIRKIHPDTIFEFFKNNQFNLSGLLPKLKSI